MKKYSAIYSKRTRSLFLVFGAILLVSAVFNIMTGSIDISLPELGRIIFSYDVTTTNGFIVLRSGAPITGARFL